MIKNEREYRITRAQISKFEQALAAMAAAEPDSRVTPRIHQAKLDAVQSQLDDLRSECAAYERLQAGATRQLVLESLEELPSALIQGRIAAGLSQRELADRLGLKEQQIQRYEATAYESASLKRVNEVIKALGIRVRKDVYLPDSDMTLARLFARLREAGIDKSFVLERVLPRELAAETESADPKSGMLVARLADVVSRFYGWTVEALLGSDPLSFAPVAVGGARFKVPARVDERRFHSYSAYAHRIALTALRATDHLRIAPVPTDPKSVRAAIISSYGALTLANAVRYVWDLGIPVVPLSDSGAFHGACWRAAGRNVIVLKQSTPSVARWLHDLLHELRHAGEEPGQPERSIIEVGETFMERRDSDEEIAATQFASDVLLDGRAEELAEQCVEVAGGSVERLKAAVPKVAKAAGMRVDALANYMAFRLSLQGLQWWGPATNLQVLGEDPWRIVRDVFFERADLGSLDELERAALGRALGDAEVK